MMGVSLVIASRDEGDEITRTCRSALDNAAGPVEILVVDDGSAVPAAVPPGVRLFRNESPLGLFLCKRNAVAAASSPAIVVSDAHIRFSKGWDAAVADAVASKPDAVHVALCRGVTHKPDRDGPLAGWTMEKSPSHGPYHGANLVVRRAAQPPKGKSKPQPLKIMEGVWQSRRLSGAIPCPMGSVYGMSKAWWGRVDMLGGLSKWGGQEVDMSLRTWLAGGEVLLLPEVAALHLFRERTPYPPDCAAVWSNRMLLSCAFPPRPIADRLLRELAGAHPAIARGFDMAAAKAVRDRFDEVRAPGSWEAMLERFPEIVVEL